MTEYKKLGTIEKFFCTECNGYRNCNIKGYHLEAYPGDYQVWDDFYILKCLGCDFCFLMKERTTEDDLQYDDEEGYQYSTGSREYFPPQSKRAIPDWLKLQHEKPVHNENLELIFTSIYEIYTALNNNLLTFASIGIRTTFDIASEYLGVDSGLTFQEKVIKLKEKGLLREGEEESISVLIESGNASVHRGWKPELEDINTVMDILEDFLHREIFKAELSRKRKKKEQDLRRRVPPRSKRTSKSGPEKALISESPSATE